MSKIIGIIPARYASTRFPGKPLVDIAGKPMIQRVYEQASKCAQLSQVIVATDDERIKNCVERFGGQVMMTAENHQNGTERCAEVAQQNPADYYINIQGDEPFIQPEQISLLCEILDGSTQLGTLIKPVTENIEELENPNKIKVVTGKNGNALYFSRSLIPFMRNKVDGFTYFKHIGIYAYRSDILKEIVQLSPSPLEQTESLEQLRWLENGYQIKTAITQLETMGIDSPEDLERVLNK